MRLLLQDLAFFVVAGLVALQAQAAKIDPNFTNISYVQLAP